MSLISNIKKTSIAQVVKIICQLTAILVFAKLLTPTEFGVVAMATVVINFANIIRDIGTNAAIISRDTISHQLKSTLFWVNFIIGITLFSIIALSSELIAAYFNNQHLRLLLIVLCLSFPLNSVSSVHLALLERESKFSTIAKVEIFSSVISLIVAIVAAANHFGAYSLVIQTLLYSLLSSIFFIRYSKWSPFFVFDFNELKSIFNFSSNIVGFNFINYFSRNSDQIIIGKIYGPELLGNYSLAYRMMLFPLQSITFVLTRSLFPIISRIKDDKIESGKAYLRVLTIICLIVPPLMIMLSLLSFDVISLFFPGKWDMVPNMLMWLAPTAILQSMISTTGSIFMAFNRVNFLLKISIFNCALQMSAFLLGSFFDVYVLLQFYFIANLIMFLPNVMSALSLVGLRYSIFLKQMIVCLVPSGILFFILSLLSMVLCRNTVLNLFLKCSLSFLVYIIAVFSLRNVFENNVKCL